jgi:hypothetical protein
MEGNEERYFSIRILTYRVVADIRSLTYIWTYRALVDMVGLWLSKPIYLDLDQTMMWTMTMVFRN